jgi:Peptidase family C25
MSSLRWLLVLIIVGGVTPGTIQVVFAGGGKTPAPKKLLIVAQNSDHATLKPFVEHKKKLLPTEVVSLEAVLKDTKGADDAEKLKRYLYNRWKKDNVGYVLLVGDAEVIPVRYFTVVDLGEWAKLSGGLTFLPSDLYYSDLAKQDGSFDDWNSDKEGKNALLYGLLKSTGNLSEPLNDDQIDYRPDVALGRWPVHTKAQLEAVIAKTILYENHVISNDLPATQRSALVIADPAINPQRFDQWIRQLEHASGLHPQQCYVKRDGGDDKIPVCSPDEVTKVLGNGVGMMFHVGHGDATSWGNSIGLDQLKTLKDARLPPLMYSVGCDTAAYAPIVPWDCYLDIHGNQHDGVNNQEKKEKFGATAPPPHNYQRGKFNKTSMGVEWLRAHEMGASRISVRT